MKIVSNVLQNIDGIQLYYIIGLLIFVVMFVVIFIRTYILTPTSEINYIKNSIFDEDNKENVDNNSN
jgi:hypothetical protein